MNNKGIVFRLNTQFPSLFSLLFLILIQVTAAVLAFLTSRLDLYESSRQRSIANALTHISMGLVFVALFCDVVKMNFGLDPAVPFQSDRKV